MQIFNLLLNLTKYSAQRFLHVLLLYSRTALVSGSCSCKFLVFSYTCYPFQVHVHSLSSSPFKGLNFQTSVYNDFFTFFFFISRTKLVTCSKLMYTLSFLYHLKDLALKLQCTAIFFTFSSLTSRNCILHYILSFLFVDFSTSSLHIEFFLDRLFEMIRTFWTSKEFETYFLKLLIKISMFRILRAVISIFFLVILLCI